MEKKKIGILFATCSLTVAGISVALSKKETLPKSSWADPVYSCALPSGYSELGVICGIALNANSNVTNTHTVRGTVTRSVNGTTYIQRVNQTNGELESIALLNSGTYTPGNVLDISGGVLNNSNGVPYLDVTNASVEVSFSENITGYEPTSYDSITDFINNAFDDYTYPYSQYVELTNVKVEYEVGNDSIFTLSDIDNSSYKIYGEAISSDIRILLDDYYLRGSNLDIKGVLYNSDDEDVLRILQTSDISLYDSPLRNVQDTTILQAWNWSISNINNQLTNIKNAGFKTIQVSPMQPQKDYQSNEVWSSGWWKLYQPYGLSVATSSGQSVIGTASELKALTANAKAMGINVIVDVVCNHLAGGTGTSFNSNVASYESDIYSNNRYHTFGATNDTNQGVVQGYLGSYPDLKTEETVVQNRVISMLKTYIDCGVSGFRFDAAKHIETPSDGEYASNFWTNVLGAATSYATSKGLDEPYYYGEILGAGGSRSVTYYTDFMSVSDSATRDTISAVNNGNTSYLSSDYGYSLSGSQVVQWPESHDNYKTEFESSNVTNQFNINKAYAIQASRQGAATLFLARPEQSTTLGNVGSTAFKDAAVVTASNKFHNELVDASEYIKINDGYFINVRKGSERNGVMIVNVANGTGTGSINLNVDSNMMIPDGTYTDLVSGNEVTVSGGYVTAAFGDYAVMALLGVFKSGNSINEGFGLKINNSRTILAVDQNDTDYEGRQQYKIVRQSFTAGDTFSLYDFSTQATWAIAVDPYSFGGNSNESVNWTEYLTKNNSSNYTVIKDFTADIYIKIKNEDDQIYFDITGLTVSSSSESLFIGNSTQITVSKYAGAFSATSSDTSVATVSKSNDVITIKAIELGSATIAVTDGVVTRNISISVVESITFTVTDLPNWIENNSCVIFAWAWGGNAGGGEWYSITISGTTGTFSAPSDITGFNMARCVAGTSTPSWSAKGDSTGRVYNKTSDVSFLSGTTTYKSPDWVEYVP